MAELPKHIENKKNEKKTLKKDPFEQIMNDYPCYRHMFNNMGLLKANGMSFIHEIKQTPNKSQEDIAKKRGILQLQTLSSIKGADAILGLQVEFTKSDIGVCICTVYGNAVKYKK